MADIVDVARAAGVSTATVSRALRGLPNVSPATRDRVRDVARELDYQVSRYASALATGRTHTVGVVVPQVGRWFFGQVVAGAEEVLRHAGLDLLLYSMGDRPARERFFADLPLRGRVDAALVLALPLTLGEAATMRRLGIRWPSWVRGGGVRRGADRRPARCPAGRAAPRRSRPPPDRAHLRRARAGTGLRRPGGAARRLPGALAEAGLPADPRWQAEGDFTVGGGDAAMTRILAAPQRPTAVFAMSDEMAIGALRALRRHGLAAPADVSLIGFDDHEVADLPRSAASSCAGAPHPWADP